MYPSAVCGEQSAAGLGGDDDLFFALALQLRDQAFAAAHAVNVGGVDEVDAAIDGGASAAIDSASSTAPHAPPMAHAPKLISETFQGVLPS